MPRKPPGRKMKKIIHKQEQSLALRPFEKKLFEKYKKGKDNKMVRVFAVRFGYIHIIKNVVGFEIVCVFWEGLQNSELEYKYCCPLGSIICSVEKLICGACMCPDSLFQVVLVSSFFHVLFIGLFFVYYYYIWNFGPGTAVKVQC
jgi:hypothetical protein